MERLRKEPGSEEIDDVSYRLEHVLKRWDDRFAFSRPDLLKRYLGGGIDLHVHYAIGGDSLDQWCLNIAAANDGGRDLKRRCAELWPEVYAGDPRAAHDANHEPVLVDVVEAGEDCEGMILRGQAIRSVARLMVTDGLSCLRRDARYFGPVVGLVANQLGADRKFAPFQDLVEIGIRRVDLYQQSGDGVIEGGAQLMQHLSGDDAQLTGVECVPGMADGVCEAARTRIKLGVEYVRVETFKLPNLSIKFSDVLFGPI